MSGAPRIIYASNRQIGRSVLDMLLGRGVSPVAAMVGDDDCGVSGLIDGPVFVGKLRDADAGILSALEPDYLLSIHYPYILPASVLDIPRVGALNLHPAYLPYNRGWHTPSWAIIDGTPAGATLHWMTAELDAGPIVAQDEVGVYPGDTAHGLYQRILDQELRLMERAIPMLIEGTAPAIPQEGLGTVHTKADLARHSEINLDSPTTARAVLDAIRARTTNLRDEAAWFHDRGRRYVVTVEIAEVEQ